MLDKSDLKAIGEIVDKKISDAFSEFWHKMLAPYLDKEHEEIMKRFDENDKEHEKFSRSLQRNQEEHDEMFTRLDRIEKKVDIQGGRIRKLEIATAS